MTGRGAVQPVTRRTVWARRIAVAFVLWLAVSAGASLLGNQPRPLLLALGVAAGATVLWLFLDVSADQEPPRWESVGEDVVRAPGEDPRLALLTRVVAQHLDARDVGDTLHRHLLALVDARLLARHGVAWRVDPDRAEALLPGELVALARQQAPYPRMRLDEIDLLLRRIEAL